MASRSRRSRIIYNPAFVRWQDNLTLLAEKPMTLVDIIRLLIDQANNPNLKDYPVTGDVFWPAQQLYDTGNEVLVDFWPMLARQPIPVQLTNTNFVVSSGTDIFTFDNTVIMIPSYVVLNSATSSGASMQVTDQKYWISDVTKLEQYNNNWRMFSPAQPRWFVNYDAFHIRTFPSPDQTYTFTLFGVPWTTELSTGTEDVAGLDPIIKLSIAYKAAANVLEATRPDTADWYIKESEELLERYRIRLRNAQSNNMRRMKPGVGGRGTDKTIAAGKGVINLGKKLS